MIGTGGQSSAFPRFRRGRLGYSMTILIVGVCRPALGDDFRRSYRQSVLPYKGAVIDIDKESVSSGVPPIVGSSTSTVTSRVPFP